MSDDNIIESEGDSYLPVRGIRPPRRADIAEDYANDKLRAHNYYNQRNAEHFLDMIDKWADMQYQDCFLAPGAFGITKSSLRIKLTCAKVFVLDKLINGISETKASIVERTQIRTAPNAVVLHLRQNENNEITFATQLQPATELPLNPCERFTKWLADKPQPRQMFIIRDVELTDVEVTWFKQTVAALKPDYDGEINKKQVVIIKLSSV